MINAPVRVRDALKDGTYKKNYRINVFDLLDEEKIIATIENNNLVSESVSIDERMCSGDDLKFGLCEGSNLEFQYFDTDNNKIGNITGHRIKIFLDVEYSSTDTTMTDTVYVTRSLNYDISNVKDGSTIQFSSDNPSVDSEVSYFGSEEIGISYSIPCTITKPNGVDYVTLSTTNSNITLKYESNKQIYSIPMGYFTVDECSRQASTGIIKVSCYNKLKSDYLDQKANSFIEEMQSDGNIENVVSVGAVIGELLDDYKISPDKKYIIPSGGQKTTGELSAVSFKFNGTSTTRYFGVDIQTFFYHVNSNREIELVIDEYIDLLKTVIEDIKIEFDDQISNSTLAWENFKKSILGASMAIITIFGNGNRYNGIYTFEEQRYVYSQYETHGYLEKLKRLSGVSEISINFPTRITSSTSSTSYVNMKDVWKTSERMDSSMISVSEYNLSAIEKTKISKNDLPDVTLRDLQSAVFEVNAQYGSINRNTDLFSGISLNGSRLYPANTLYPSETLFPNSTAERANKAMYSALWADEGNVRSFKYLIITYKGLNEEGKETDMILQRTINEHGTDNYNMSDNWLFRNLVWTANQIGTYADTMVPLMRNVTWFPFEMWCAGLPYLETGDEIEINTAGGTYISYILSRKLSGIQNLQDTFQNGTLNIF